MERSRTLSSFLVPSPPPFSEFPQSSCRIWDNHWFRKLFSKLGIGFRIQTSIGLFVFGSVAYQMGCRGEQALSTCISRQVSFLPIGELQRTFLFWNLPPEQLSMYSKAYSPIEGKKSLHWAVAQGQSSTGSTWVASRGANPWSLG